MADFAVAHLPRPLYIREPGNMPPTLNVASLIDRRSDSTPGVSFSMNAANVVRLKHGQQHEGAHPTSDAWLPLTGNHASDVRCAPSCWIVRKIQMASQASSTFVI